MQSFTDNFPESDKAMRLHWVREMVRLVQTQRGYRPPDETLDEMAHDWYPRFYEIPTTELPACKELGAQRGAKNAAEFVLYWDMKRIADHREKYESKDWLRYLREKREMVPEHSLVRDAIFKKWGRKTVAA